MSLDTIIRSALRTANSITSSLQAEVSHEAFLSANDDNEYTYSAAVTRTAVVEYKPKMVRTTSGEEKVSKANLMFVEPVSVDPRDRFTLPDGTVAPVLSLGTVVDPTTNEGYYKQVFL